MKKKKQKEEEIVDSKRYRNFMILFYDESKHYKFDDLIFNLHSFKYYAYIKHQPEDEEKTAHYHAFIRVDSATTEQAIANRLGIPESKVKFVKNVRSSCRYLTHIDYIDKIQYDLGDVVVSGAFQRKFYKQFEDVKTEEEIISELYDWIDNEDIKDYHTKLKCFIVYVNSNCYDTIFKRYRFEFIDYLKYSCNL